MARTLDTTPSPSTPRTPRLLWSRVAGVATGMLACAGMAIVWAAGGGGADTPAFVDVTSQLPAINDWSGAVALGDVDGDSDIDALIANSITPDALFLNDGAGNFSDASSQVPAVIDSSSGVVLADLDGDGDLDGVYATANLGQNRFIRNDGAGNFTDATSQLPSDAFATEAVAAADVDGDNDLDLVFGNSGQNNALYRNDGTGTFTDVSTQLPSDTGLTRAMVAADVDGDNDLDLIAGDSGASNRLFLNGGTGTFTDASGQLPAPVTQTLDLTMGDVDGDGDLDLAEANTGEKNRLYVNNGSGTFTDVSSQIPLDADSSFAVLLMDFDGDFDADLVFGNALQTDLLYENTGGGNFIDVSSFLPSPADWTQDLQAADVDGDNDPDIYAATQAFFGSGMDHLYRNESSGQSGPILVNVSPATGDVAGGDGVTLSGVGFQTNVLPGSTTVTFGANPATGITVVSDTTITATTPAASSAGAVDVTVTNSQGTSTLTNGFTYTQSGALSFADVTFQIPGDKDGTVGVAMGDVDGDQDPDVLVANDSTTQNLLYLDDGMGLFTDATSQLPAVADSSLDVALADTDGDNDLDVLVANFLEQNRLYLNTGSGTFTDATFGLPADTNGSYGLAVGDFDGDGDADVFVGNAGFIPPGEPNRLYRNIGFNVFLDSPSDIPVDSASTQAVAAGDIDGDNDLDLLMANAAEANALYRNDGTGVFTDISAQIPGGTRQTLDVAFFDLDGDGDLDFVEANQNSGNLLARNNGTGFFVDASANMPADTAATSAATPHDFDGDLDLDIFFGNTAGQGNLLYENIGGGLFQDATAQMPADTDWTEDAAFGDIDGDTDDDLWLGVRSLFGQGQDGLYRNDAIFVPPPPPTLTSVSPLTGVLAGGVTATLTGSGFKVGVPPGSTTVDFGGSMATNVTVVSKVQITCTVPAGPALGPADVTVTNSSGSATLIDGFVYNPAMTLDAPPSIGTTVNVEAWGQVGDEYTGLLGVAQLATPIPLPPFGGLFCLDPTFAIVTICGGTIANQPEICAPLAIPNNPLLVGLSLYIQGLIGPSILGGNATFSNCLVITFQP